MRRLLFAANWKMHLSPPETREYFRTFLARHEARTDRDVWFFPPAVSVETAADAVRGRPDMLVGIQDIHWEPKGAFTGAVSAPLAAQAGIPRAAVRHAVDAGRRRVVDDQPPDLQAFRGRVRRVIESILSRHAEGSLLVVCHGAVINAYLAPLLGVDHEMFFVPENTSLNSLVVDGDARRVRFLNDALHLTDPHLFADA